jgi:hypothetical protein
MIIYAVNEETPELTSGVKQNVHMTIVTAS